MNTEQRLNACFKSIAEQDDCAIVICSPNHTIIYMNSAAKERYQKYGGEKLVGESLLSCHNPNSCQRIEQVVEWFLQSPSHNKVHTFYREGQAKDGYMIALRDEAGNLVGYYEKHEFRTRDCTPFYLLEN